MVPLKNVKYLLLSIFCSCQILVTAQRHPEIYVTDAEKDAFLLRISNSAKVNEFVAGIRSSLEPYVSRHQSDPELSSQLSGGTGIRRGGGKDRQRWPNGMRRQWRRGETSPVESPTRTACRRSQLCLMASM